ncbi:MAG TPA: CGNR zinc finger domain-containing protein [Nocardioides sp.]|nr:CGNR zinc finger domain-containing protein [Nocardioides sp.]
MTRAWIPPEWLSDGGAGTATDLDLAVVLLNSLDLLDDPADRLSDLAWWCDALRQTGHEDLAATQRPADLPRLRELRETLRAAFEADSVEAAAATLNPALLAAGAVVQVGAAGLTVTGTGPGGDLAARLLAAVAAQVSEHGTDRLGVCASDPCRCAYVDRTRAATRRYCCSVCNDRAAARAYRRRRAAARPG